MEFVKKTVKMNTMEGSITHQFYVGEDVNVPDAKDDIVRILQNYGKAHIQEIQKLEQYVKVRGYIEYQILYAVEDEEKVIDCMAGKIPIDEMIYMEGEHADSYVVKCNQLDMQSLLIHSRKVSIKAMLELQVQKSCVKEEEIVVDVESESQVIKKFDTMPILELHTAMSDTFRIKEEVKLPATKENIGSVLLSRIGNMQLETRAGENEFILQGEFQFFCMYISDEWKEDFVAQTMTFEGRIACMGIEESMFHHLQYDVDEVSVDVQMDEDGEMRILHIEATLHMHLCAYEENEHQVLTDLYMLEKKCMPCRKPMYVESVLLQNQSKCKIVETLMLPELRDELLQICTANGVVQIEQAQIREGGIEIEGILHLDVLYICGNDRYPYASWQGMVPFTHFIECPSTEKLVYDMENYLEQVSISMAGNGELEVKAVVNFHSFLRKPHLLEVISDINVEEFSMKEIEEQAGIIGYIYKDGDNLWNLAKKFHTTVEGILKNNKIDEKDIKGGQKLLIFKENISIL